MADNEFEGELKELIEALIFAADHPLSVDKLSTVIEGVDKEEIKKALEELVGDYESGRGIVLSEVGGGYQLRTRQEHAPWIKKFFKVAMQRISKQAMEAMAIVAYKQPVTRGELEEIRGVDSGGVLKTLLDKRLIKIVGKKDIPGRPVVYGTTKEFLEVFDLQGLTDLPTLKDIEILKEDEEEAFQAGLFESRRGDMLTDAEIKAEREIEKALEAEVLKEEEAKNNKQKETDEKFASESEEIDEESSEEEDGEYSEEGEGSEEPEDFDENSPENTEEETELEGLDADEVGGSGNDQSEEEVDEYDDEPEEDNK